MKTAVPTLAEHTRACKPALRGRRQACFAKPRPHPPPLSLERAEEEIREAQASRRRGDARLQARGSREVRAADKRPRLTLIAALARNGVIGRAGRIPWQLPGDLPRFKRITLGHPVIMGRKTWESLGRPLPGRRNLVISRAAGLALAGAEVFASLAAAITACQNADEAFVIGGTEAYREALPLADRLLLTEIDADIEGDAHFPPFDRSLWREVRRETHPASADNPLPFAYVDYERA